MDTTLMIHVPLVMVYLSDCCSFFRTGCRWEMAHYCQRDPQITPCQLPPHHRPFVHCCFLLHPIFRSTPPPPPPPLLSAWPIFCAMTVEGRIKGAWPPVHPFPAVPCAIYSSQAGLRCLMRSRWIKWTEPIKRIWNQVQIHLFVLTPKELWLSGLLRE